MKQCIRGNVPLVKKMVQARGDNFVWFTTKDESSGTHCIHEAARHGNTELVDYLVKMKPIIVKTTDSSGMHCGPE